MMTPEEFEGRMTKIAVGHDEEVTHADGDALMCEVLVLLGYGAGVAVYRDMPKWYA